MNNQIDLNTIMGYMIMIMMIGMMMKIMTRELKPAAERPLVYGPRGEVLTHHSSSEVRRLGIPRSGEVRAGVHEEFYGTTELPPRGTGLIERGELTEGRGLGEPKGTIERGETHKGIYGTSELPERGRGLESYTGKHYWRITDPETGEILEKNIPYRNLIMAKRAAVDFAVRRSRYEGEHEVKVEVFDVPESSSLSSEEQTSHRLYEGRLHPPSRTLVEHHSIHSEPHRGDEQRYYAVKSEFPPPEYKVYLAEPHSGGQLNTQRVFWIIKDHPGITFTDIWTTSKLSMKEVDEALNRLEWDGYIRREEHHSNPGGWQHKGEILDLLRAHTTVESWGTSCISDLARFMGKPVPTTREEKAQLIREAEEYAGHHSIHGPERQRLVDEFGTWAIGRAESVCPEDDVECVRREAGRLIYAYRRSFTG